MGAEGGLVPPQAPERYLLPRMGGLRSQGQWPWRGGEGLLRAGAGEEGSAQSRPGFALQASGRRSPESCSKPEKILKRGTYDKVAGLDWACGGGTPSWMRFSQRYLSGA